MVLEELIAKSWSKETSSDPNDWTEDNPARGQCAVTALIVQDMYGGNILNMLVDFRGQTESHYMNLVDGKIVDLTGIQYEGITLDYSKAAPKRKDFASTREYILSYPQTQKRYELLKNTLSQNRK
ncbi:MAG: hypothetical protein KC535_05925 [Nanoarchaeota archaeon]|nr:hypothetical protein [Nanoarchaeota archaeon]